MMNFGLLRRQAALVEPMNNQPELTVVGEPAAILAWPRDTQAAESTQPATAELRMKRFSHDSVERDQYTATIAAPGRSMAEVMRALAETCSSLEEFGRALGAEDHLIVNIQVRL